MRGTFVSAARHALHFQGALPPGFARLDRRPVELEEDKLEESKFGDFAYSVRRRVRQNATGCRWALRARTAGIGDQEGIGRSKSDDFAYGIPRSGVLPATGEGAWGRSRRTRERSFRRRDVRRSLGAL